MDTPTKPDAPTIQEAPRRQGWHARLMHRFDCFAGIATRGAGSPLAFALAALTVALWAITGPMFGYSETWQLVINTGTTIITFLMVFLIQQSQNKDSLAIHLKLNELLASHKLASNRLVSIEDLDEEELKKLAVFYRRLSELSERDGGIGDTHEVEDAHANQAIKREASRLKDRLARVDEDATEPLTPPR
jgi:low affinity Fe/Cu permease